MDTQAHKIAESTTDRSITNYLLVLTCRSQRREDK